jgi:hypothetical protein
MKNHVYANKAQITEELKMCICDETAGTDEALQKVMKKFTQHVPECIASKGAHLLHFSCHTQNSKVCKIRIYKQILLPF